MNPKVYNRKGSLPADFVFVGRPSKWGNPFVIGRHGDRAAVIARYREYITAKPMMVAEAKRELKGKDLVCFCAPLPCHADVLLEIANKE